MGRVPDGPKHNIGNYQGIAQLAECLAWNQEAEGSNPSTLTLEANENVWPCLSE